MFKITLRVFIITCAFISNLSFAHESYTINLSTDALYVNSLNIMREGIGHPISNVAMGTTRIFELPSRNYSSDVGIEVIMTGVSGFESEDELPIRFIIDPVNLYLAGFTSTNTNIFYRFRDMQHITAPNITSNNTVTLSTESSYTALQRTANMSRENMTINRNNLITGSNSLNAFIARNPSNGAGLDQDSARAIIRYITIVPEALRFRQIQRNFRPSLSMTSSTYTMGQSDLSLTLNWDGISSALPLVNSTSAPGIQVQSIRLPNEQSILQTIAVSLNCNSNRLFSEQDECVENNSVIINGFVWSKKTVLDIGLTHGLNN